MKKVYLFMLIVGLVGLIGCSDKEESTAYETTSSYDSDYTSSDTVSASDFKISGVSSRQSGGLHHIVGEITNTSNTSIDDIGDLALYDEDGNLIRVKKIIIKLSPGETMAFDEIVGLVDEVVPAKSVKLGL